MHTLGNLPFIPDSYEAAQLLSLKPFCPVHNLVNGAFSFLVNPNSLSLAAALCAVSAK